MASRNNDLKIALADEISMKHYEIAQIVAQRRIAEEFRDRFEKLQASGGRKSPVSRFRMRLSDNEGNSGFTPAARLE